MSDEQPHVFRSVVLDPPLAVGFTTAAAERVNESAREIPVAYDVDVVVVGGGTGAVAAAVAAAKTGPRSSWPRRIPTWATT